MAIDIQFPAPCQALFVPKRYKVLYGGRGAGRSWAVARALLLKGTERPIRVLCARELQKSIDDSVHKLLSDQIIAMGLTDFYTVLKTKIIGANGTSFGFEGIRHNIKEIKSYEGADYCWVEEAVAVSRSSWGVLIPTIRKTGSEIWLTFNPELDTDYTYTRFVKNPELKPTGLDRFPNPLLHPVYESDDTFSIFMTWKDNPWFPEVLRFEMEKDRARDPDYYLNVWEGHCLQMLEGVVFAKELRRAQEEGRICQVPWDRESPVDTFWDLGRRDMTSIWFAQRVAMQWRVLGYFEDSQEDIHYYLRYLQNQEYVYGRHFLPHDAASTRIGEKRSIEKIVRGMAGSASVHVIKRTTRKVNAINAARIVFPNCWFDEDGCSEGLQRLRKYRYRVVDGQLSDEPLHDENSNGADAFMALGQSLGMSGGGRVADVAARLRRAANIGRQDRASGLGWMG